MTTIGLSYSLVKRSTKCAPALGCELLDSPFGFVSGCKNHGVNWNSFLAPSGFILLIIIPMALIHFVATVIGVLIRHIKSIIKKQKT